MIWNSFIVILLFYFGQFLLGSSSEHYSTSSHKDVYVWFLHRSNCNFIVYIEYFFNDNFIICNGYSDNSIARIFCESKVVFLFPAVYLIFQSALYACFLFGSSGKKQTFLPVFWKFFILAYLVSNHDLISKFFVPFSSYFFVCFIPFYKLKGFSMESIRQTDIGMGSSCTCKYSE